MPPPRPGERFPRSRFLEASTLGLGAVIGGAVTVPAVGLAVAPPFVKQGHKDIDIGPVSDYPQDKYVIATFMADKAQGEVSRRTAFVRYNGQLTTRPTRMHATPIAKPTGQRVGRGSSGLLPPLWGSNFVPLPS